MITNFKIFSLLEASNLNKFGLDQTIISHIHKDYALEPNATWIELKYKKDIISNLKSNKNTLILQIEPDYVSILITSYNKGSFLHFKDIYKYDEEVQWGGTWNKGKREEITNLEDNIYSNSKWYLLKGDFSLKTKDVRDIQSDINDFDSFTNQFKTDFISNFYMLVNKMYGKKAEEVKTKIINDLKNVSDDISKEDSKAILLMQKQEASKIDYFNKKAKNSDPYGIRYDIPQANSLSIFDEFIITFEEAYTDKLEEFVTIKDIADKISYDKLLTSFLVFMYSGVIL